MAQKLEGPVYLSGSDLIIIKSIKQIDDPSCMWFQQAREDSQPRKSIIDVAVFDNESKSNELTIDDHRLPSL
jgi:hypothetical protein